MLAVTVERDEEAGGPYFPNVSDRRSHRVHATGARALQHLKVHAEVFGLGAGEVHGGIV